MEKRIVTFDKTKVKLSVPYTHMSYEDGCRFYGLMNDLLTYANERLGLFDVPRIVIDGTDLARKHLGTAVGEKLWKHRELVGEFVRTNPFGACAADLEVVAGWRHAVRDLFVCVGANEDVALQMNRTHVFAVGAMEQSADAFVHAVPSLMLLTLIPYQGGIVTDGKVIHISDEPLPSALPLIRSDLHSALRRGAVTTSEQLAAYDRAARGRNQISPAIQSMVDRSLAQLVLGERLGGPEARAPLPRLAL